MTDKILHLMTQDNQPYGSVRKCCQRCGLMMTGTMNCYTDDKEIYKNPPKDGRNYVKCDDE